MRSAGRRWAVLLLSLVALLGSAGPGHAADQGVTFTPVPETGAAGHLRLASSPYPLVFPSLRPGQQYSWQLRLRIAEGTPASTSLRLSATGALAARGGYLITVRECSEPWTGSSGVGAELHCPGEPVLRVDRQALKSVDPQTRVPLAGLPRGRDSYLAVSLQSPAGGTPAPQGSLRLGLGITAQADDDGATRPPTEDNLGWTGFAGGRLALLGGGVLLAGAALWAAFRRGPETATSNEVRDDAKDGGAS